MERGTKGDGKTNGKMKNQLMGFDVGIFLRFYVSFRWPPLLSIVSSPIRHVCESAYGVQRAVGAFVWLGSSITFEEVNPLPCRAGNPSN